MRTELEVDMAEIPNMEEEEEDYQTRVDVCLTKEEAMTQGDEPIEYQATLDGDDDNSVYPNNFQSKDIQEEIAPEIKRGINCGVNADNKKSPPSSLSEYRVKYGLQLDDVEEEAGIETTQNERETRDESNKTINVHSKKPASMDVDRSIIIPQQEQPDDEENIKQNNELKVLGIFFLMEEFNTKF